MDRNSKLIVTRLPDQGKVTFMTLTRRHCFLTGAGCVLSGINAVIGLISCLYMRNVVKLAVTGWPDRMDRNALVYWRWMTVISSLTSMLIYFGTLVCAHPLASRTVRSMRTVALHHLTRPPVGYFKQRGGGKSRCIIDDGVGQTETYLAHQLSDLTGALVTPAVALVLLLVFDWRFGLIDLIPVAVDVFFLNRMMGPGMAEYVRQYQNALEDMNNEVVEYVRGIPVVKTLRQGIFSFKNFHNSILRYRDWTVDYTVSLRAPMCVYTVSINGIFALLIPTDVPLVGDISGGAAYETIALDLLFYTLFTPICVSMMDKIMWTSENTMTIRDATNRILDTIKEEPLPGPAAVTAPPGYTVGFRDVSSSYDNTGANALNHVSLTVPQSATATTVRASGSRKTALVSLIPRFFDMDRGSIYIGGVDVREIDNEELMRLVSSVLQDCHLFKSGLLNDIRAARPQTTKGETMRAVVATRCEDIIEKMPQGLDTVVGTKGIYLSDGEVQRIALARAVFKDVPVVLSDKVTVLTDPDNEYLIQRAFEMLVRGKTAIVIAHRLSTVCHLDRISVLEQGRIAEQGRHEELLQSEGLYAKMWKDRQTSVERKAGEEV